jgi:uncharacterized membrane protein
VRPRFRSMVGRRGDNYQSGSSVRAQRYGEYALPLGLAGAAAIGFAAASVFRHDHFGSNAYDLGLFDQTVWGYNRLEMLPNTVVRLPNLLGDHFHPILIALAPLYWVWSDPRMLLVFQAAALAASSLPIFWWARERLGLSAAVLFQVAYLAFWAVLGGNIFDFHEVALAAPIVSFALYGVLTRRDRLVWATAALALLTREDLALTFAAIGVYVAVVQRRRWMGAALAVVCVAWFAVTFKLVIPAFADRSYSHWWYGGLGSGPGSALVQLVAHPLESIELFFTPRDKRIALFNLFAPWLVLPLLSPLAIVMLPALGARFFSENPSHWAPQSFHYSLVLAPVLAFATVDTVARLERLRGTRGLSLPLLLGAAVLAAGLYFSFVRLRPLDELERYTTSGQIAAIRSCLDTIPPDASVAATSALVPHLSHRPKIYVLDDRPVPETAFVAIDVSTWMHPLTLHDVGELIAGKRRDGFGVVCSRRTAAVLARDARDGPLSPELSRLLTNAQR